MKRKGLSPELKVGFVVLFGIVLLFYMSIKLERFGLIGEKVYEISVYLDNASGIDPRSSVKLAGVTIGRVKTVSLEGLKAKVVMMIKEDVKIPKDSTLLVRTEGVLGDRYIEILPGIEKSYIPKNGIIEKVESSPSLEEMLKRIDRAALSFGEMMGELKGVIGEKEKVSIKESLKNIRESTREFSEILSKNKDNITRVIANADHTVSGLKRIVENIEEGKGTLGLLLKDDSVFVDAKALMNEAKEAAGTIKNIAKEVEEGKGALGKLLKDDSIYLEAKDTVKNLREITDSVRKGEGTLGKLAKDETLYIETKRAIKDIQRASEGVQEMTPVTVLGTLLSILF